MNRVIVYRNLHRGDWSVATAKGRDGTSCGKVLDHRPSLVLANVVFRVSEASRQRVCRTRQRAVHAWAVGEIVDVLPAGTTAQGVTYNPYRCGTFTTRDGAIASAAFVAFTDHGAFAHTIV